MIDLMGIFALACFTTTASCCSPPSLPALRVRSVASTTVHIKLSAGSVFGWRRCTGSSRLCEPHLRYRDYAKPSSLSLTLLGFTSRSRIFTFGNIDHDRSIISSSFILTRVIRAHQGSSVVRDSLDHQR
ncbi:hypothetical protein F4778DRAFT_355140 [Xylariomycetidae sp. FL2044]|nr:hypothetical protein F4778DRAFT_355140 [Xylariomycetidae sp. FL2044]